MKRCLRMLIAAAVLTLIVAANAFAAGNPQGNFNAVEGAQPVGKAACFEGEGGQGDISGTKKPAPKTDTRPFGAVHEAGGFGFQPPCSVPLPDDALFIVD
jgi:hypothetical protein